MNKIQSALIVSYLLMTCYFLINWLTFHLRHPTDSAVDKFLSLVMMVLVTIFWPVVIPMHFIQTFKTREFEFSTVLPMLIAISTFGLVFYQSLVINH